MPAPLVDTGHVELDQSVARFLETQKLGTARAYRMCLKRFYAFYPPGVPGLIEEMVKEEDLNKDRAIYNRVRPGEKIVQDFVSWHSEIGYSNKATYQSLAALQGILKYYAKPITLRYIKLLPDRPMAKNKKHEWALDQVKKFVEAAEYLRDKAYIIFAFQSGLSIGDILDLNYGDIQDEYEAGSLPLAIEGYRQKTNIRIRTFVGRDAVHYLRLYLESRVGIKPSDPLFTLLGNDSERATPGSIQKLLRQYAEKLDFIPPKELENGYSPVRSHSLRSGFKSRLTGKMDSDLIECFMAHDIGQQRSTYMNQPLDDLREIYASYEHLLSIEKTSRDELAERSGKTKIPEEALTQIRGLETTVTKISSELDEVQDNNQRLGTRAAELEMRVLTALSKIEALEKKINQQLQGFEKFIESLRKT